MEVDNDRFRDTYLSSFSDPCQAFSTGAEELATSGTDIARSARREIRISTVRRPGVSSFASNWSLQSPRNKYIYSVCNDIQDIIPDIYSSTQTALTKIDERQPKRIYN